MYSNYKEIIDIMKTKTQIDFAKLDGNTLQKIWDNNGLFRYDVGVLYEGVLLDDVRDYMATLTKDYACEWETDAWNNCHITVNEHTTFVENCRKMWDSYVVLDDDGLDALVKAEILCKADELIHDEYDDYGDMLGDMITDAINDLRTSIEKVVTNELCSADDDAIYTWFVECWIDYYCLEDDIYMIDDDYILYKQIEKCYK